MALKEKIKKLPAAPGVYIMKDAQGRVIYVGKATSLKDRVRSYFRRSSGQTPKQHVLVRHIADIDYIPTVTEEQALFLESRLIKQYAPKYNVSLKDGKSYPLVKITNEPFPLISVCRPHQKVGARFFGPYSSAELLRDALKIIRRVFPYRSCRVMPKNACLDFHLKLCPAPCIGAISKKDYMQTISTIALILEGKQDDRIRALTKTMQEKARAHDFEAALKLRDTIEALASLYRDRGEGMPYYAEGGGQLRDILNLAKAPQRIEAFDISNIFGKEAVGSMVSFYKGRPDKNNYRRFKIKQVNAIDDYQMIAEVTRRRYSRLKREGGTLPDLIIIDGGKGQLSAAKRELDKLGLTLSIMSIAKEREKLFIPGSARALALPFDSAGLQLVRRVRDEAHRFALAYHHILRRRKVLEEK